MEDDGEASDIKDLLLSSVGLEVGSQDLVSLGGDNLSLLLASDPVLGLLARLGAASDWAGVVFLTERLTMGTIESGILAAGKNIWTVSKKYFLGPVICSARRSLTVWPIPWRRVSSTCRVW